MTTNVRRRSGVRLLPVPIVMVLAATGVSACTASQPHPHASSTAAPVASQATPAPVASQVASQVTTLPGPAAPGSGSGYRVIVSARGRGNQDLGVFKLTKNSKLIVQISCYGPPPITVPEILEIGPCGGGDLISTDTTTATSGQLGVRVTASPKLFWAIYVSQPRSLGTADSTERRLPFERMGSRREEFQGLAEPLAGRSRVSGI
jgi:hypothetical protein